MENIELKEVIELLMESWVKKIMFNWKVFVDLENIVDMKIWDTLEYKSFSADVLDNKQQAIFTFIKK